MAELAILPTDRNGLVAPKSGDTLVALHRRGIEDAALFRLTHPKRAPRLQGSPLLVAAGPAWEYHRATRAKLVEALSADEIRVTDLTTLQTVRETYDVRAAVQRRHRNGQPVWGTPARPRWFVGSRRALTDAQRDALWSSVETDTPERRAGHQRWPWSDREKQILLVVPVQDFDDDERGRALEHDMDRVATLTPEERAEIEVSQDAAPNDLVRVRFRRRRVPWEDLVASLGVTVEDVRRPDVAIDRRGRVADLVPSTILQEKGARRGN